MLRGCMRYESLLDGSVSLADVALANDALDVKDENDYRAAKAARNK